MLLYLDTNQSPQHAIVLLDLTCVDVDGTLFMCQLCHLAAIDIIDVFEWLNLGGDVMEKISKQGLENNVNANKLKRVTVRFTEEEKEDLERQAKLSEPSLAALIRRRALHPLQPHPPSAINMEQAQDLSRLGSSIGQHARQLAQACHVLEKLVAQSLIEGKVLNLDEEVLTDLRYHAQRAESDRQEIIEVLKALRKQVLGQ